jgi:pyruvate/2-oxoglutarate dehydrogenase complex dihydrolipoamide acyltransferase (E2) component
MDITLPKWGMTMQEAAIGEWLVAVGDQVAEGQPIARIETDKVDTEIGAPATGTITEIVAPEGTTVSVGALIARMTP